MKDKMKKPEFIYKEICSRIGGGESTDVRLSVDTSTGEAQLIIEYSVREYHPVTDYEKVIDMYEKLGASGRKWLDVKKVIEAMWS